MPENPHLDVSFIFFPNNFIAGFLAELFLPVLFMALLILIKSITTAYDSPNIAFFCGNAYPWYYNGGYIDIDKAVGNQIPWTCTQKPKTCDTSNYYQDKLTTSYDQYGYSFNFSGYTQYGKQSIL